MSSREQWTCYRDNRGCDYRAEVTEVSKKTYRVKVRESGTRTWEVNATDEEDARNFYFQGVLVYDNSDGEVESVVQIDIAEGRRS